MRNVLFASLALGSVLSAGCDWNTVSTGDHGVLTFTPDDCGQDGCDLRDSIVVGGSAKVTLDTVDDAYDVDGITLISSAPSVLRVEAEYRGSLWSDWRITGVGRGYAELIAIDWNGYEIDHIEVYVDWADRLTLDQRFGDAVGPEVSPGFDQVWTVNAYEDVGFQVEAIADGDRMMGELGFAVDIDEALFASLRSGSDLAYGELYFNVAPGDYDVRFTAPDSTTMNVLIRAR
jgi:hypothetical protein